VLLKEMFVVMLVLCNDYGRHCKAVNDHVYATVTECADHEIFKMRGGDGALCLPVRADLIHSEFNYR
jgi:hypothetical protein